MINQAQKKRLQILARDVGYTAEVNGSRIEVGDVRGVMSFADTAVGYHAAVIMLQQLRMNARKKGGE